VDSLTTNEPANTMDLTINISHFLSILWIKLINVYKNELIPCLSSHTQYCYWHHMTKYYVNGCL
jgi:hypothetical protein